jgi:hypothetical protein
MSDESINADFLKRAEIPVSNLFAAGLNADSLKARGLVDPGHFIDLGFDALHLSDQTFCTELISAFGAISVVSAFLKSATDSVSLAGSPSCHLLDVSIENLLSLCAGCTVEACAVVMQHATLTGATASTILDTGMRVNQLTSLGYTAQSLHAQTNAMPWELVKLGF